MLGMTDPSFEKIKNNNNRSIIVGNLTEKKLKNLNRSIVFACGEGTIPSIQSSPIRWVAKRGNIDDWAIYFSDSCFTWDAILHHGDKLKTEENIRLLVPCDDDTFKKYRF